MSCRRLPTTVPRLLVAALVAASLAGCGGATVADPAPVVAARAYLTAVADGRTEDAWRLRASSGRRATPQKAYAARLRGLDAGTRERARVQSKAREAPRYRAEWGEGRDRLQLEHRGGTTWAIVGELPRFEKMATAAEALATFARALRAGDWETVLKLAPEEERRQLTPALVRERLTKEGIRQALYKALDALRAAGAGEADSASQWSFRAGRHRAIMVREGDSWRLLDLR